MSKPEPWQAKAAAELSALDWIEDDLDYWDFDDFEATCPEGDDVPGLAVSCSGGRLRMLWGSNEFECDVHHDLVDAARRLMAAMEAFNIDPAGGDEARAICDAIDAEDYDKAAELLQRSSHHDHPDVVHAATMFAFLAAPEPEPPPVVEIVGTIEAKPAGGPK